MKGGTEVSEILSVKERVFSVIAGQLEIDAGQISEKSDLDKDLGVDSLDEVEIVLEVEEEFDIDIPHDRSEDFRTVGDIIDYVERVLQPGPC